MSWRNGDVLEVKDEVGCYIRMLVQDGKIHVVADGASLSPVTMMELALLLYEGAKELDNRPVTP